MTKKELNRESLNFIEYLSWEGIVKHSQIEEEVVIYSTKCIVNNPGSRI